jgi:hypothetical protein
MIFAGIGVALMLATDLPMGSAPAPVALPHFPDRVHAFVWRNWTLVPVARLAKVLQARPQEIRRMGEAMGLPPNPAIPSGLQRRSALTIIRRNWHLLPYEQLLQLLDWTPEQMAYTLREDDFLYIKLGSLKPRCEPLRYQPPDDATLQRERAIAAIIRQEFPADSVRSPEPLFTFVSQLSQPSRGERRKAKSESPTPNIDTRHPTPDTRLSPRFCYSYFALYGDPLMDKECDPYPDGYLARLAEAGVNGVWLQAVLYKLAPFPWDSKLSEDYKKRLDGLKRLVARAKRHGIGVYLYLNEPRAMPLNFYAAHPDLKGVIEGDHATLCTSHPDVQRYLTDSIASVCRAVPDLAGFFTITASENLTNCWSHHTGANCPRCAKRSAAEVIAEVNARIEMGIREAKSNTRLIAWDWGWSDAWAEDAIRRLPESVALQSVSEWNLPIARGGVKEVVGEYSISAVGPGPRAKRHWEIARQRGLQTLAKIQAGNTWELSAVPYIPALENVAQHAANLRDEKLDGLMLGWTLGGYPSPNLEVVAEIAGDKNISPTRAMEVVAQRRFGAKDAPAVVEAWRGFSAAFREFPYHIGVVYSAPLQLGPANLFWSEPTRYTATMVGFPYDDLDTWRAAYPPETFSAQLDKVADGFERSLSALRNRISVSEGPPARSASSDGLQSVDENSRALAREMDVAEAAAIHFRSVANQARFVVSRRALSNAKTRTEAAPHLDALERVLKEEIQLARRLYAIQSRDSRIGFEASNQYYYVPTDLMEKVLNAHDLLTQWLPTERRKQIP